jgi:phosphate ABC transporter permease protein PstC
MGCSKDKVIERLLLAIAFCSVMGLFLIAIFIFKEGLPIIARIGLKEFIFSSDWSPLEGRFGILSMIVGSLCVAFGTLVFAVPLGVGCAIFLSEFSPKRIARIVKPCIELLFAIPSVVYGFMGVIILIPFIRIYLGGTGFSILAASIILGIMILPAIVGISIDALQAVPKSFREGSIALGATNWQTTWMVILPAARSGIIASIILSMGQAIGETMAVIMIAGNAIRMPTSVLDSVRTLTSNIALEMGYATGAHREALFACGIVLFVIIMILNIVARFATKNRLDS